MTVTINGSGTIGGISVGGLNDNIITKNEMATGGAWAPAGTVLQVVSTNFNPSYTSTTSGTYVDTGLSLSITLSSSSNKVLILVNGGHGYVDSGYPGGMIETICRQSSTTYNASNDLSGATTYGMSQIFNNVNLNTSPHSMSIVDTPATTNPTYRVFFRSRDGGDVVVWQEGGSQLSMTLMEIAA